MKWIFALLISQSVFGSEKASCDLKVKQLQLENKRLRIVLEVAKDMLATPPERWTQKQLDIVLPEKP